jgi:hypothetical protein
MVAMKAAPIVAAHPAGWQRDGDFGFLAEQGGVPLSAV